jgi:O-methyltransferase
VRADWLDIEMSNWKRHVNRALAALTGYQLTRANPVPTPTKTRKSEPPAAGSVQAPASKAPAAAVQPQSKKPAKSPKKKPEFPVDFDEDYCEIIRAVRPYTMTGNDKLHALISATKYIHKYNIPGAVVECGVWRGGSMHAVARTLDALHDHFRELYLFDTFDGMVEPTDKDARYDGLTASQLLETSERSARVWAYASLEDVQAGFANVPYPPERIRYIQGRVEETIPGEAPEQIALLRLDTDWYASTKHELEHLYPRLVPGGVLFIDDYGWWQGSRAASDEFLANTGARLLLIRTGSGRVAVKL